MRIKNYLNQSYLTTKNAFCDKKLRSGAGYLLIIEISQIISGFIAVWVVTYFLSRDDYAILSYANSFLGMLGFLSFGAVGNAVAYAAGVGKDGGFLRAVRIRLKWCIIYSILIFLIGLFHLIILGQNKIGGCLIAASLFLSLQAFDNGNSYLQGIGDFRRLFLRQLFTIFLKLIATTTVVFLIANPVAVFTSQIGSTCLIGLVVYLWLKGGLRNNEVPEGFDKLGLRLSAANAASTISRNFDRILVAQWISLDTLAPYSLAKVILIPSDAFGRLLNRLLFHRWADDQISIKKQKIFLLFWLLFMFCILVAGIAYLTALWIIPILFPKYGDALPFIPIFLFQGVFTVISLAGANYMNAQKVYHRYYVILQWLQPLAYLVILAPLTLVWGAIGVALSGVFTQLVALGFILFSIIKVAH